MTNKGLAYVFKEGRLSTTSGNDLEHNKFVGQVSTIFRCLTSKDGDLLSQFDNINEEIGVDDIATADIIRDTSLRKVFIDNHNIPGQEVNRGKIKSQLPLEHIFGFRKTLKRKKSRISSNI